MGTGEWEGTELRPPWSFDWLFRGKENLRSSMSRKFLRRGFKQIGLSAVRYWLPNSDPPYPLLAVLSVRVSWGICRSKSLASMSSQSAQCLTESCWSLLSVLWQVQSQSHITSSFKSGRDMVRPTLRLRCRVGVASHGWASTRFISARTSGSGLSILEMRFTASVRTGSGSHINAVTLDMKSLAWKVFVLP